MSTRCEAYSQLHEVGILAGDFEWRPRERDGNALGRCIDATRGSDLRRPTVGNEEDRNAVLSALYPHRSDGRTEHQASRLTLIKRTMLGRMGLDLLR